MQRLSRRAVLASGVAAIGTLAGCTGLSSPGDGEGESDGGGSGGDGNAGSGSGGDGNAGTTADADTSSGASGTGTQSPTATPSGLALDTFDVGGSPGKRVPVQPTGQVVLLDFFATWCAPCKPQMKHLRSIRERFGDVHMLSITWEKDASAIKSFWTEYEGTWPVANDPQLRTGQKYGVKRIPTLIVFDDAGEEVWRHTGLAATDSIVEHLQKAGAPA